MRKRSDVLARDEGRTPFRAAVLGSPVSHSLSPVIHEAGYAATGLTHWRYDRIECAEDELEALVASFGPEWAGLSVTMPLKERALAIADEPTDIAAAIGSANTLLRRDGRLIADNTDAPGMVDALAAVDVATHPHVAILGAGGTARAALAAAAQLEAESVTVYARRPEAIARLEPVADSLGLGLNAAAWHEAAASGQADLVVSTAPAKAAPTQVDWRTGCVLFDVIYDPWPTPLATRATTAGCLVVDGLELLLAQGVRQFELFCGVEAPTQKMRAALHARVGR